MIPLWIVAAAIVVFLVFHVVTSAGRHRQPPSLPPRPSRRTSPRGQGDPIPCVCPSNGERLGECRSYTKEDVDRVYQECRTASQQWRLTSFSERRAVLQSLSDWIVSHQREVVEWSVADSGKTVSEAALSEVMFTCEKVRWTIAYGERALKREYRPTASLMFLKSAYVDYLPLGVVGVIVPWNYPFQNVVGAVAAALMAGNGCVVKVSEWASHSAEGIENMLRECLAARGHDPNLIQIVCGYGPTGAALVDCGVDKVLFIGSPAVGKLVMKAASARLTPVILELGGKDPFIVFDDCDFNHMADLAIRGAFVNCGQNCISAERFYVQKGIYEKFISTMTEKVKSLAQGHSKYDGGKRCDVGAMTMPSQVKIVEALIDDAVKNGAKVVVGGKEYKDADAPNGRFFAPTILRDVTHKMKIANEEAFGPVMTVIKFDDEKDLIAMVNSTEYGLGSSLFTTDYKKAERVQKQLECGMVNVNEFGMVPMLQCLPFGGIRSSGFGAFNGYEGLRGFSRTQAVCTDRFGLRADSPAFLQYPMKSYTHHVVKEIVRIVYGKGYGMEGMLGGIVGLLKMALGKGNGSGKGGKGD